MIEQSQGKVLLFIRVQPRAGRNEVVGVRDGVLSIRVTAVPEKGAANKAVIALLAKVFKLPKSTFSVYRGTKSRDKVIAIEAVNFDELHARVKRIL